MTENGAIRVRSAPKFRDRESSMRGSRIWGQAGWPGFGLKNTIILVTNGSMNVDHGIWGPGEPPWKIYFQKKQMNLSMTKKQKLKAKNLKA